MCKIQSTDNTVESHGIWTRVKSTGEHGVEREREREHGGREGGRVREKERERERE